MQIAGMIFQTRSSSYESICISNHLR
ncbi:MAG: DUF6783 domain-containing protein [Lachnospiraceae bacterium]